MKMHTPMPNGSVLFIGGSLFINLRIFISPFIAVYMRQWS